MNKVIPDFTKLNWQFNVAIMAGIFSVFAVIYNERYIAYGFVTFSYGVLVSYGVLGNMLTPSIENIDPKNKTKNYLIVSSILTVAWLLACLTIYFQST